jgi:hypothetical protein
MLDFAAGAGRRADLMVIRWAYRLTGPVDVEALREALAVVVRRHAVLRQSFRRGPAETSDRSCTTMCRRR